MKNKLLLISLLTLWLVQTSSAQGSLKTNGPDIVNEKGEKVILRGMGLGGWMLQEGYMLGVQGIGQQQHVIKKNIAALIGKARTQEFYEAWLANHTRKIDIDSMKAWGFNSVRLAMHYNLYTLPVEEESVAGQHTWLEKGFAMTDSLLKWCAANQMYLILDLHAAPGGQGNDLNICDRDPSLPSLWQNELNVQKTIALWRKLADRYKDEPWLGAYDIINEPNWGFESADDKNGCGENTNAPLRRLLMDITTAIREVDKKHIIIIEGNCWGNNYNGMFPLWDDNLVVSFHKYWNYNDKASIQKWIDLRAELNVPVWLGESGENSNVWFRDAIHLMESNGIGWAWWPLKKLGHNNPLQVKVPEGYRQVQDYWAGSGPQPQPEAAYRGLMDLAGNLKLENCIFHRDVIEAMFRQPHTNEVIPFTNHAVKKGAAILAADYDLGRNGFAYVDKDTANYWVSSGKGSAGNRGHTYRNDGVDIFEDEEGVYVESEAGEWMQYTVHSASSKSYAITLLLSAESTARIQVILNGKAVDAKFNTQGKWQSLDVGRLPFRSGANVMRLVVMEGKVNLRSVQMR